MPLKLFNTSTRRVEPFQPLADDEARLYTCGPTVYDFQHVGNYRTYVFEDVLVRALKRFGFKVRRVMNITDVGHLTSDSDTGEDKMEVGARRAGKSAWDIAKYYTEAFLKDVDALNILRPDVLCRATDHIPEQIELIKRLEAKGLVYKIADGVYFATATLPDYGKLDPNRLEGLKAGARVEQVKGKKHPTDFALWKLTPKGQARQMEWDSPWGKGFPGWHIECSAMAMKYLGESFDIHCGGIDHVPIHHTNEIAQSEGATGEPFARWWMHGEFLLMSQAKMAKSAGGFITLEDLGKQGIEPLAYRLFCFSAHYRKSLEFSWEALAAAQKSLGTLREHAEGLKSVAAAPLEKVATHLMAFDNALADDLNMPEAMAAVWSFLRSKNLDKAEKHVLLANADQVLGLRLFEEHTKVSVPVEVDRLIQAREDARKAKDFAKADQLRKQIAAKGFVVEDTPQGPRVKKPGR